MHSGKRVCEGCVYSLFIGVHKVGKVCPCTVQPKMQVFCSTLFSLLYLIRSCLYYTRNTWAYMLWQVFDHFLQLFLRLPMRVDAFRAATAEACKVWKPMLHKVGRGRKKLRALTSDGGKQIIFLVSQLHQVAILYHYILFNEVFTSPFTTFVYPKPRITPTSRDKKHRRRRRQMGPEFFHTDRYRSVTISREHPLDQYHVRRSLTDCHRAYRGRLLPYCQVMMDCLPREMETKTKTLQGTRHIFRTWNIRSNLKPKVKPAVGGWKIERTWDHLHQHTITYTIDAITDKISVLISNFNLAFRGNV
jgi:hypothetical protein